MFFELTIPQYSKMLMNLSMVLDKAAATADAKKYKMEVLLQSRLAPDMLPLVKQIQIACDAAKFSAGRLTGKDIPTHEDNETTHAEVKARIESTIAYLKTFKAADFDATQDRRITQPRWEGKSLSSTQALVQNSVPNFYFHVTMAYAILRHNGIEIGKTDFLGEMPFEK